MSVVLLSLLIFELIQKAALNFILFLNIFKILFWTFWEKNSLPRGLFFP